MNILIFSWRGPRHPNAGGAEIVTHEHAKAWVKAGHKVTLFTSHFEDCVKSEIIDGVHIIRSGGQLIGVKLAAIKWYLFINKEKFDVVFDHFHGIPFFTPLFVRTRKIGFIHEVAGEVWKLNILPKPIGFIPSFFGPLIEPLIFNIFYRTISFITVSESTKNELVKIGIKTKNITIINNGINTVLPRKISKEKKKTAVYLGAISKDKGTEDAIKIFSNINRLNNDWQFWIIGKGSEDFVKNLKLLSKKLGIFEKTKFWGFVSDKKKFELLSSAHVFVNPSVLEGWGLVNIEANACGLPVIGYNISGVKDSVIHGKTGYLFELGDSVSVAKACVRLVDDKRKYEKLSENAKNWSKQFDWKKSTKQSLKYLEKL